MAETALRPRSGVEIIDAAFSLLKRDYLKFITIMGIFYLPYLVALMLVARSTAASPEAALVSQGLMSFASVFWFAVMDGAMIVAASDSYLGRNVDIAAVLGLTLGRFGTIVAVGFLKSVAVGVGVLFFLVGSVWAGLTFFAAPATVVIEKNGAWDGMKRSAELTRGFKWSILGTLFITYMIFFFLMGLSLIPAFFIKSELLTQVCTAIVTILVYPMVALVETLLYYDLRIRKEGFDIELMTKELGEAPAGQLPA